MGGEHGGGGKIILPGEDGGVAGCGGEAGDEDFGVGVEVGCFGRGLGGGAGEAVGDPDIRIAGAVGFLMSPAFWIVPAYKENPAAELAGLKGELVHHLHAVFEYEEVE
jgi:hypothetical protein